MNHITKDEIITWLKHTVVVINNNKDYLTQLDAAIGDADHGSNMERGFAKVVQKLEGTNSDDIGEILQNVGMALLTSVGGAAGPLYGKFFTQFGKRLRNREELALADLIVGLEAGFEAVKSIGKSTIGEKTMNDVWHPVLQSLQALDVNIPIHEAINIAVDAAEEGVKSTIGMIAKKGRASYLGERSIGHQDPGATSSYLILKSLKEVIS